MACGRETPDQAHLEASKLILILLVGDNVTGMQQEADPLILPCTVWVEIRSGKSPEAKSGFKVFQ